MPDETPSGDVAVLVSGGVDSAILAVDLLRRFQRVFPLYIRFGLRWETVELDTLRRFLDAARRPGLMPLTVLDEPVADVYGAHWSLGGPTVPDADAPHEADYLPGRNLLLLSKAAVWCRLHEVSAIALGALRTNPFPDNSPEFFRGMEAVIRLAVGSHVEILRPFEGFDKSEVLRRGAGLPLEATFSCYLPRDGRPCGFCLKCGERRKGFRDAGLPDRTEYASPSPSLA